MSLKAKIVSFVAIIVLVVGLLVVGVLAATNQQKISMKGNINFVINDKNFYINDVRLQQGMSDTPKTVPGFIKGFINGEYQLDLSKASIDTNSAGSFLLYFDIINFTVQGQTSNYIAEASWTNGSVEDVSFEIRESSKYIAAATVSSDNLSDSTPLSGTIMLEVNLFSGDSFDLSDITITIRDPQIIDVANFSTNEAAKTATVTSYTGLFTNYVEDSTSGSTRSRIILPSSISLKDGSVVEGGDYLVTTIGNNAFDGFSAADIVVLPSSITTIGNGAFQNSSISEINIPYGVKSIGSQAFMECYNLSEIIIPESVTSIGTNAFALCSSLTTVYIDSPSVISNLSSTDPTGLTANATTVYVKSNILQMLPSTFPFTIDSSGAQMSGYKKFTA